MNDIKVPCFISGMHTSSKQQSNLQLVSTEKLTNVDESTTKLAGNGSAQGTGPAVLNR